MTIQYTISESVRLVMYCKMISYHHFCVFALVAGAAKQLC